MISLLFAHRLLKKHLCENLRSSPFAFVCASLPTAPHERAIAEASFATLKRAMLTFMNEIIFKRSPWIIRSKCALNFAFTQ
jgi:hypothetical protein